MFQWISGEKKLIHENNNFYLYRRKSLFMSFQWNFLMVEELKYHFSRMSCKKMENMFIP